ncbi:Isotrichodermin C-15 hydroxylase [Lasiodiplodia theobromae]|uniref:Isotrichodermin C-15 hydroxylase n=1 Tax=Lasiodiplodia theobromae TaxID=45133 RepID=A0A5N5DB68_9PEZI|nr:Isotrichodermin C-15 hydroxylase [Lasiodiplodia theobromae]
MAPTWLAPIVAGVVAHAGIQLVEIDMFLPYIGMALSGFWAACLYLSVHVFGATIVEALVEMLRFSALVSLGLTASMLVYRGFFHRLRRFPGPWQAKFTKLYAVWLSARKVQWHLEMKRMHEEYGDVVRTGPRELSITRAEAIAPLAACRKSTLYALSHWNDDRLGLIETRSIRDHRLRRKPWDTALNSKALAKYDPSLQSTIGLFLDAISTASEAGQKPINVTDWVAYLAYDLMGMIGFGRDFGQLRGGGVEHWAVKALRAQQLFIGVLKPIPWLLNFLAAIPGADGPVQPFVKYCAGLVAEKREAIAAADKSAALSQPSDICTYILQAYEAKSPNAPRTQAALDEDGRLIVIAGADTTSNTLINALYYLSRQPHLWRALQSALTPLFPGGPDTFSYAHLAANLAQAPLLDAIINETMRLKPATPGGNPRVTPPEGLTIVLEDDDEGADEGGAGAGAAARKPRELHIPGSTDVYMSPYVLHRSPRYFVEPDAFVPERWIADRARGGRPELIKKPGRIDNNGVSDGGPAFFPFQVGQFACAGKALAMWEMRSVLARMALRFDLGYERNGDGGEDVEGKRFDEGMKDTFTMTLGPMWLRFKERGRWWEEGSG